MVGIVEYVFSKSRDQNLGIIQTLTKVYSIKMFSQIYMYYQMLENQYFVYFQLTFRIFLNNFNRITIDQNIYCVCVKNIEINLKMLGQTKSLLKCQSQSAIRHKVRKLRAKVRAIIPNEICDSHIKRNQLVEKMNQKRIKLMEFNKHNNSIKLEHEQKDEKVSNSLWKLGTLKQQQWYIANNTQNSCTSPHKNYEFSKLKQEQIELINEDKQYYLGQKNIQAYNNFLRSLKPKIYQQTNQRNNQAISTRSNIKLIKHKQNQDRQILSYSLWNDSRIETQSVKENLGFKSRFSYNKFNMSNSTIQRDFKASKNRYSTTSISKFHTEQKVIQKRSSAFKSFEKRARKIDCERKIKNFQQRRLEVQQQQKQRIMYQKLKMEVQTAKVEANQREVKNKQFLKIKEHQDHEKQKLEKAVRRKSILIKNGQIAKIGAELRSIMIKRRQNIVQQDRYGNTFQPNKIVSSPAI